MRRQLYFVFFLIISVGFPLFSWAEGAQTAFSLNFSGQFNPTAVPIWIRQIQQNMTISDENFYHYDLSYMLSPDNKTFTFKFVKTKTANCSLITKGVTYYGVSVRIRNNVLGKLSTSVVLANGLLGGSTFQYKQTQSYCLQTNSTIRMHMVSSQTKFQVADIKQTGYIECYGSLHNFKCHWK